MTSHPKDSEILELIRRVEERTGADRELDAAISAEFNSEKPNDAQGIQVIGGTYRYDCDAEWSSFYESPPYTASVDASLALVERVLPGAEFSLTNLYGVPVCELPLNYEGGFETARLENGTLPRAILSALLRALLNKEAG